MVGFSPTPDFAYVTYGRMSSSVCCSAAEVGSWTGVETELQVPLEPPDITTEPACDGTQMNVPARAGAATATEASAAAVRARVLCMGAMLARSSRAPRLWRP